MFAYSGFEHVISLVRSQKSMAANVISMIASMLSTKLKPSWLSLLQRGHG